MNLHYSPFHFQTLKKPGKSTIIGCFRVHYLLADFYFIRISVRRQWAIIIKWLSFSLAVGLAINHTGKPDRINLIFTIHHYSSGLNLAKAPFSSREMPVSYTGIAQMLHSKERNWLYIYLRLNNKCNSKPYKDFQGDLCCSKWGQQPLGESPFRRAPLL